MKFTNNRRKLMIFGLLLTMVLNGCGYLSYDMAYNADSEVSSFNVVTRKSTNMAAAFASDLCVVTDDITDDEAVDMSRAWAAALFDLNNTDVIYAKSVHERLYPASLTKVMTALVALKYGSPDQVLTATNAVNITEPGAQLCGIVSGDTMTLSQALHILLMYSANDVAMLIAENIGGTPEHFMEMMNREAISLGATNTNFTNPHGLFDVNHYTSAYDLYLIFNEAIQYEAFSEIIHMASYQTTYYNGNGQAKEITVRNTNQYIQNVYEPPENITVIGGKTGTTNESKNCLILLTRDVNGAPYISVILGSDERAILYAEMTDLLDEINK